MPVMPVIAAMPVIACHGSDGCSDKLPWLLWLPWRLLVYVARLLVCVTFVIIFMHTLLLQDKRRYEQNVAALRKVSPAHLERAQATVAKDEAAYKQSLANYVRPSRHYPMPTRTSAT